VLRDDMRVAGWLRNDNGIVEVIIVVRTKDDERTVVLV